MRSTTAVHSDAVMRTQRAAAFLRDQYALSGMQLYAQITLGTALYLFRRVSTPSWMAALMTLPVVWIILIASGYLANAAAPGKSVLFSILPRVPAATGSLFLSLSLFIDAQIALYCFCAVVTHILPQSSLMRIAATLALAVPLAVHHGDESALGRAAGFFGIALIAVILFTFVTALPFGDAGHLFPLLGEGAGTIMKGAFWLSGAAACACVPALLPTNKQSLEQLSSPFRPRLTLAFAVVPAAALSALVRAYLLPFYAMARPETLGSRLLVVPEISPSIIGWSLYTTVILLLMILVFAAAVTASSAFLRDAFGKRQIKSTLTPLLIALATVPLAALNLQDGEKLILIAAPCRLALTLLPMAAGCAAVFIRKKRGKKA